MSRIDLIAEVIGTMQVYYGDLVEKRWGDLSEGSGKNFKTLATAFATALDDLGDDDIKRGILNLRNEQWLPTIPGFRALCLHGCDWFTPDQAWAIALELHANPTKTLKTTEPINRALRSVQRIFDGEGQRAAAKAFKDNYFDLMQRQKRAGRVQEIIERPGVAAVTQEPEKPRVIRGEQGLKHVHDVMKQFGMLSRSTS